MPTAIISAPVFKKLKLNAAFSEETPNFTGIFEFAGVRYNVSNDGCGGANRYSPPLPEQVEAALNEWAAAASPLIDLGDGKFLAIDFETWTFEQAFSKE